jgi:hypothetical protein
VIHGQVAGEDRLTAFRNVAHADCDHSTFEVDGQDVTVAAANETGREEA